MNESIVKHIVDHCRSLTLTTTHGKFLADKSYGFDTMFFVCRFINRFRFGDLYHKQELQERSNEYVSDLFCLTPNAGQVGNYFTEACALLKFAHILSEEKRGTYRIINHELLDFIASGPENAYIFLYLLTYCVFKNDGIWDVYRTFCEAPTIADKEICYAKIKELFRIKDSRIVDPSKLWSVFVPKYPMNVLGYANQSNCITRTGRVRNKIVEIEDVALNVPGTRANYNLPKKNSYIDDMSISYIWASIYPYLVNPIPPMGKIEPVDTFSIDVADTKLDMFDAQDGKAIRRKSQVEKYTYSGGVKARTVQGEFRAGLLKHTPHICPICGFRFEDFLIASHIKPYAKCDDTYDAMNHHNGLLMCPICDKLFESANYMTIDYQTGRVVYDERLDKEKDFDYLKGRVVDYRYIDCERRHYLKWHNEFYNSKHEE